MRDCTCSFVKTNIITFLRTTWFLRLYFSPIYSKAFPVIFLWKQTNPSKAPRYKSLRGVNAHYAQRPLVYLILLHLPKIDYSKVLSNKALQTLFCRTHIIQAYFNLCCAFRLRSDLQLLCFSQWIISDITKISSIMETLSPKNWVEHEDLFTWASSLVLYSKHHRWSSVYERQRSL